jgi:hypothetical protein
MVLVVGVAEPVRQQVQELAEAFGAHRAEARGQVEHPVPGHPARQAVVEGVGQAAPGIGLAVAAARAHGHVVAGVQPGQQLGDPGRVVLAIGVHEHEDSALRGARPALDRRAVAHGIGIGQHPRTVGGRDLGGGVGGSVVDDDHLGRGQGFAQGRQRALQPLGFVPGRQHHCDVHRTTAWSPCRD